MTDYIRTGQNLLITGQPRSGKSVLARTLLDMTDRAIVLDPLNDYQASDPATDLETDSLDVALAFLAERYDTDFRLIYRHEGYPEIEYEALFDMVEQIQIRAPRERLAVFLEEASQVSTTHAIGSQNRRLFNMGNRWGISFVTVIQVDTDIHRVTRRNSQAIVACRQHALSGDMGKLFRVDDVQALEIVTPAHFAADPDFVPVQGVNFLVAPDSIELYEWWADLQRTEIP